MISSQIREKARESLSGKWGKAALLTFIYAILTYLISWICMFIPIIGSIAYFIISVPLAYGLIACFIKLKRNEGFGYLDFFTIGFSSFSKVWSVTLNTLLKLIVPIIIVIVCIIIIPTCTVISIHNGANSSNLIPNLLGIIATIVYIVSIVYIMIKSLLYSLNNYILFDNPNMTGKEVVEKSASLMNGNRWKLFCLTFSFIGWAILTAFTFGIGMFWLLPYIMISTIVFYENLAGNNISSNSDNSEDSQNDPIQ